MDLLGVREVQPEGGERGTPLEQWSVAGSGWNNSSQVSSIKK